MDLAKRQRRVRVPTHCLNPLLPSVFPFTSTLFPTTREIVFPHFHLAALIVPSRRAAAG